jgi:hypothetical protein
MASTGVAHLPNLGHLQQRRLQDPDDAAGLLLRRRSAVRELRRQLHFERVLRVVLSCACSAQDSAQLPCASVRTCAPAVVNHRASWPPAPCRGWFSTATGVFVSVLPTHSPHPADSPRSNLAAALGLLSSGGFSNPKPGWRAAERRHPTGRERMGSPNLQTLQEPILPTPWVCFRGGGQTLTFPWSMRASSPAAGSPLNHAPVTQ